MEICPIEFALQVGDHLVEPHQIAVISIVGLEFMEILVSQGLLVRACVIALDH